MSIVFDFQSISENLTGRKAPVVRDNIGLACPQFLSISGRPAIFWTSRYNSFDKLILSNAPYSRSPDGTLDMDVNGELVWVYSILKNGTCVKKEIFDFANGLPDEALQALQDMK